MLIFTWSRSGFFQSTSFSHPFHSFELPLTKTRWLHLLEFNGVLLNCFAHMGSRTFCVSSIDLIPCIPPVPQQNS
jgi:hypothetical protein